MTAAPIRSVHVVCDSVGATQAISFEQPLAGHLDLALADRPEREGGIAGLLPPQAPDALVLSRVTAPEGLDLARGARARGVPVVFHLDDDLLDVPESLGAAKARRYRDPARLACLRANIEAADLVYASTTALAARLREHGIAAPVVAGEIYCSVDPGEVRPAPPSEGPVLGYMGTGGHAADLDRVMPAVVALLDRIPGLRFEVFGTIKLPSGLDRFGARARHVPPVADYREFLERLRSLGWSVGLAPLADHPFNRCKADTKWVELSFAGVAVVAEDLPVYRGACSEGAGALAASLDGWTAATAALLTGPARREAMVAAAQARLRRRYGHDRLREQVLAVLSRARALAVLRREGVPAWTT